MCVHHANKYMIILLTILIRLVHMLINEGLHYHSSLLTIPIRLVHMLINEGLHYHSSLLTLITCENILVSREKCLRRKQHLFKGCIDTMK